MRCEKIQTGNLASSENSEQNKYFTKEIETLKKTNRNSRDKEFNKKEIRNELASIENGANQVEKWISDIEDRNIETMKREKET